MKLDVTVSVEKSGYDLMLQLSALALKVKEHHAAGGTGIPGDLADLVGAIMPIISDIQAIGPDMTEDKLAFIKGVNLGAYEFTKLFA